MAALDAKQLMLEVRANHARLGECARHDFQAFAAPAASPLAKRYRCSRCLGEVDGVAFYWWSIGIKQATENRLQQPFEAAGNAGSK